MWRHVTEMWWNVTNMWRNMRSTKLQSHDKLMFCHGFVANCRKKNLSWSVAKCHGFMKRCRQTIANASGSCNVLYNVRHKNEGQTMLLQVVVLWCWLVRWTQMSFQLSLLVCMLRARMRTNKHWPSFEPPIQAHRRASESISAYETHDALSNFVMRSKLWQTSSPWLGIRFN